MFYRSWLASNLWRNGPDGQLPVQVQRTIEGVAVSWHLISQLGGRTHFICGLERMLRSR